MFKDTLEQVSILKLVCLILLIITATSVTTTCIDYQYRLLIEQ